MSQIRRRNDTRTRSAERAIWDDYEFEEDGWEEVPKRKKNRRNLRSRRSRRKREHPDATLIFILALIGLLACGPLGPVALILYYRARKKDRINRTNYDFSGLMSAGMIIAWISTVMFTFSILYFGFVFGNLFLNPPPPRPAPTFTVPSQPGSSSGGPSNSNFSDPDDPDDPY